MSNMQVDPSIEIIIAEDDDIDFKIIEKSLRKDSFVNPITRAHDGEEALAVIEKTNKNSQKPYILLVDINMPKIDGLQLIRKIRSDLKYTKNMVFVLSGSKSDEQKLQAYDLNITSYISKDRAGKDFYRLGSIINQHWKQKNEDNLPSI